MGGKIQIISEKHLGPRIYKEFLQLKKETMQFKNGKRTWRVTSPKLIHMSNDHMKRYLTNDQHLLVIRKYKPNPQDTTSYLLEWL